MWWCTYRNAGDAGLELGQRARRDRHEVADAADLDERRANRSVRSSTVPRSEPIIVATAACDALRRIGAHAEVAQRQRRGVGGVGRLGRRGQPQPGLHHALHLRLVGAAPAGDAVLHLVGRELHDIAPGRRGLGQRQPAGLADAHRRAHVDLEEHLLDGHGVGLVLAASSSTSSRCSSASRCGSGSRGRRADDAERDGGARRAPPTGARRSRSG